MNRTANSIAVQLLKDVAFPEISFPFPLSAQAKEALELFREGPMPQGQIMKEMTSDRSGGPKGERELNNSREYFRKHLPQADRSTQLKTTYRPILGLCQ